MLTRSITTALTSACLLLPFLAGAQDPAPKKTEPAPESPTQLLDGAWQLDAKWEGLLGAWQLMTFEHATEIVPVDSIRGYITLQEGFMAMIIHKLTIDEEPEPLGQAGIFRWQMTLEGVLQTATMMGHSNFGEDFEWEPPNAPREFRVELNKDDLALTRPDLSRLIFRRIKPGAFPKTALDRIDALRGSLGD